VVVGGGLAGLTAALTLLDRGAKVVIVDKEKYWGGNSAKASSGINAVDPENAYGDTIDIFKADTKAGGHDVESQDSQVHA
jgi:succinate dehydrogenase/fumarate reductase flavoprotein subunit